MVKKNANKVESQLKADQATTADDGQAIQQAIVLKAYELYEKADRIDGHDIEHWLEAERLFLAMVQ